MCVCVGGGADVVARRRVLTQCVAARCSSSTHPQDLQRLFAPGFELDDDDLLALDATYEGAHQPTTDVYSWERGGEW